MLAYVQNMFLHFFFASQWKWAEFCVRSIFICTYALRVYVVMWHVVWFGAVYNVQFTAPIVYSIEGSFGNVMHLYYVLRLLFAICHLYALCALIYKDTFRRNGPGLRYTLLSLNVKLVWVWLHLATVKRDDLNVSIRISSVHQKCRETFFIFLFFFLFQTSTDEPFSFIFMSSFSVPNIFNCFSFICCSEKRIASQIQMDCIAIKMNIWTNLTCNAI